MCNIMVIKYSVLVSTEIQVLILDSQGRPLWSLIQFSSITPWFFSIRSSRLCCPSTITLTLIDCVHNCCLHPGIVMRVGNQQYHPDRLRLKEPSAVDSTSEKFLEIEAAWRVLSDQNTRQQYDLQCKGRNDMKVNATTQIKKGCQHFSFFNCKVSKVRVHQKQSHLQEKEQIYLFVRHGPSV